MKKFDTKYEKITKNAFSQSVIISVVSILMCIVVLCSLTYAWFASETSSSSNTLMSGYFDVKITVSKVECLDFVRENSNHGGADVVLEVAGASARAENTFELA